MLQKTPGIALFLRMSRAAAAMPKLKLRSDEANDDMTLVSVLTPVPPLPIQLPRTWNQDFMLLSSS